MITLGIETSCDETACGIVDDKLNLLANTIYTQEAQHKVHGGVVPEIAARAHLEKLSPIVTAAVQTANLSFSDIDLVAFTRGPGLIGPLLVGISFAQGMARSLGKPATGVNHLEGHIGAAYLSHPDLEPPFICLTVSGGHTELCVVKPGFQYELLGNTRDDAAGEAFDKCGKLLNLGYPAGPLVSKHAAKGDRSYLALPMGLNQKGNFEFSFSGLKTAFLRTLQKTDQEVINSHLDDFCASLESAIVEILVKKTIAALIATKLTTAVICGGVSANPWLRQRVTREAEKYGFRAIIPDIGLCTDNGAMIAGIAQRRFNEGLTQKDLTPNPGLRW